MAPFLEGDFKLMTVSELKKFCTSKGLRKVSKLKRPELLKLLGDNGLQPPPLPPDDDERISQVAVDLGDMLYMGSR